MRKAPRAVRVPEAVDSAALPSRSNGERAVAGAGPWRRDRGPRAASTSWLPRRVGGRTRTDTTIWPRDATSRLSPHLHFGTLSPVELVHRAGRTGGPGADAFVRQLAWRDFHHQVLAARPARVRGDYRAARRPLAAATRRRSRPGKEGRTGYPVVDAAMRQLRHEGWMHNRARLLVASFLTKTLYVDWRVGARHFLDLLVDGDMANNQLNWQWVAGTGTDTRPNRVLNPLAQARRFDPDGEYVRRWVPELAGVEGAAVHRPWDLPDGVRAELAYPERLVDLSEGSRRFLRARR